jgi:hypothetical protein
MKKISYILLLICSIQSHSQLVSEFPPYVAESFAGIPLNSGRCQSITAHPTDRNIAITCNQFGGLWKTVNGGANWYHLNGLNAVFTNDVCFGPDGNTVICTRSLDNSVDNAAGIWVSRNGGETWSRPATGRIPSLGMRTTSNGVAWGISFDPQVAGKIYVGTSAGVAISTDNGNTWRHAMLENTSPVNWTDSLQNEVCSILAYGNNIVFALCRTGVYKSGDGGTSWTRIRSGNFTFQGSYKLIDLWDNTGVRDGGRGVFILENYNTLWLYEDFYTRWTNIPMPTGSVSRNPFVRVSNAATTGYKTVWVGCGVLLQKITRSRLSSFASGLVSGASWTSIHRAEGVHDDTGFMGLDGQRNILYYASDGGLFRPLNPEGTRWTSACVRNSGMNSYQITDLGITNFSLVEGYYANASALYFSTQDNAIWSSIDMGATWPNNDCAEGFHIEVKNQSGLFDWGLQVAYGKVGCGPSSSMFSHLHLLDQRMVPTTSTGGVNLGDSILAQAFLIGGDNYYRMRFPIGRNQEGYISENRGDNWRKRYEYSGISSRGVPTSTRSSLGGSRMLWTPFTANGTSNFDGSDRIGLVLHSAPFYPAAVTIGVPSIIYLPDNGSLGLRATEFDWQSVFGVNPIDYRHVIVPDIVNGVMKVTRDAGSTWVTDDNLTMLVTRNGASKMYNGTPNIMATRICWDPYHTNRIVVGTRENGVIFSDNGGTTWRRIRNSPNMTFVTDFAFRPDNICYVSTYGRGLWKIDFNVFVSSPVETYWCRSCTVFNRDFLPLGTRDVADATVITVHGGQITGVSTGADKKIKVQLSEKAVYKMWMPEKEILDNIPEIIKSKEQPIVNKKMLALKLVCKECVITGLIIKQNEVTGYIVNKGELPYDNDEIVMMKDYPENPKDWANEKEEGIIADNGNNQPLLTVAGKMNVNGIPVVYTHDVLTLVLTNVKEIPPGLIMQLNGVDIQKNYNAAWKQDKDGFGVSFKLPDDLPTGMQTLSFLMNNQKVQSISFIVANADDFEKNNFQNRKPAPLKEIIND